MQNPKPMLCTGCLEPNFEFADFCEQCHKPIGQYIMCDPVNCIHARAWCLRHLLSNPINRTQLLGTWCIILTGFLIIYPGLFLDISYETTAYLPNTFAYYSYNELEFSSPIINVNLAYPELHPSSKLPALLIWLSSAIGILIELLLVFIDIAILYKVTMNYRKHKNISA